MTKINLRIISKPHAYLQTMVKTSVKFQKNQNKTVEGVAHTKYILHLSKYLKNDYVQVSKKVTKINLRIISKPHAYLQTMVKTSVKFQKNQNKTVVGVAHTKYILL